MTTVTYLGGPRHLSTEPLDEPPAVIDLGAGMSYRLAGDGRTYTLHIAAPSAQSVEEIRPAAARTGEGDEREQIRPRRRTARGG